MAAASAKEMARRADRAAKAARLAGEAMEKLSRGEDVAQITDVRGCAT